MKTNPRPIQLAILGLMAAVLLLMAYTPLGYLNIGPLAVTFNVIPVAISAIALGPLGGAIAGGVFGLTSFLQCLGVGGTSVMGSTLLSINPVLTCIQCFIPRILDGLLLGFIFRGVRKHSNTYISCCVTGFFSAFLNTLFYMSSMLLLFGRDMFLFALTFVGINAVCEMISSTLLTGIIGAALYKAKVIPAPVSKDIK